MAERGGNRREEHKSGGTPYPCCHPSVTTVCHGQPKACYRNAHPRAAREEGRSGPKPSTSVPGSGHLSHPPTSTGPPSALPLSVTLLRCSLPAPVSSGPGHPHLLLPDPALLPALGIFPSLLLRVPLQRRARGHECQEVTEV